MTGKVNINMESGRSVSLFSPHLLADPYPQYRRNLAESPAYHDADYRAWVFTSYTHVHAILKNHVDFSSNRPLTLTPNGRGQRNVLLCQDPPEHTRYRAFVQKAFTSGTLNKLRPWIESKVDAALDSFGTEATDVAQLLAIPLPIMVIAEMLGIAHHRWTDLKLWSENVVGYPNDGSSFNGRKALMDMHAFFRNEIQAKRANPANDIISVLAATNETGDGLSDADIVNFCSTLLIAGNETTASLISNMLNILADRPSLWEQMRSNRSLIAPVIEESLRFESPIQFLSRRVSQTTTFGGANLAAGELIYVCLGAANRDPAIFSDADTFHPGRSEKQHLGFSHGIHFCIGAAMTRMEVEILLNRMLDRYTSISAAGTGARFPNVFFRGYKNLPLQLQE